jgi:hypothetical protein
MPKKPTRYQSVVSRQSDEPYSQDHWLKQFEANLQKTSVQPRGNSVYDEVSAIMNTKSKYPSVQAAVDDMMHRSGLITYLKVSEGNEQDKVKTAGMSETNPSEEIKKFVVARDWHKVGYAMAKLDKAEGNPASSSLDAILSFKYFYDPILKAVRVPTDDWSDFTLGYCAGHNSSPEQTEMQMEHINRMMSVSGKDKKQTGSSDTLLEKSAQGETTKTPKIIQSNPGILKTLENIIRDSKGNLPIPAIISRLHSLHAKDVSNEKDWDDDALIHLVSRCNLQAKKDNPGTFESYDNLGMGEHATEADVDASNTDAFNILMPAKI